MTENKNTNKNQKKTPNITNVSEVHESTEIVANVPEIEAQEESVVKVEKQEPGTKSGKDDCFPIVGIGASAGGLAAFEAFFSGMPADVDPGMAFILVQHLDPTYKSVLTEILGRYTRMQVFEVEDGMKVRSNCIYIIPPNCDMTLLNGVLQLLRPTAPRGQRLPIDFFFRSLAQDQYERAICIILSGTGSDGTLGVRAIKGEGGMVMVQTPESTEYDGMPRNAISTGLVDYELTPAEMPTQLIAYASRAFANKSKLRTTPTTPTPTPTPTAITEIAMQKIFTLLRMHTLNDFSQYKPSTISRRIERRMAVHNIRTINEYVLYLQQTPNEAKALFRDLLIGVTNFFRDPDAFKVLEEQVIPKIFAQKLANDSIRIWCPGCSTGEEAYSFAILIAEYQELMKQNLTIQIFATDIDDQSVAVARTGIYPVSITADLSPERLTRFFDVCEGNTYRVRKGIRDMLIFSEQNVIKDPPFSKIDVISCRNLMIYMNSNLQKKLISIFHYALKPNGILFLGTSETIGEFDYLFGNLDRKYKIYKRKENVNVVHRIEINDYIPTIASQTTITSPVVAKKSSLVKTSLREITERALMQEAMGNVAVLVNAQGDISYLHGRSGMFLELSQGDIGINNILKMAREGLKEEITSALHQAVAGKKVVRYFGLSVKNNDHFITINLTVRPMETNDTTTTDLFLYVIILEEAPCMDNLLSSSSLAEENNHSSNFDKRIDFLKQELRVKDEYLQSTREELETSNEELRSSNEEMQSVNEELQSTNEELETSKEELQSVNEELATVNAELQNKVADLSRSNNDMNNLLAGTNVATIFVDHQLRLLRFTPAATRIINLIQADVGRPVGHIVSNLIGCADLMMKIQEVLDTLSTKEMEVQAQAGIFYMMRIQPYRTLDNVIEGAVLTFVDITSLKQINSMLMKSETNCSALYANSPDAHIIGELSEEKGIRDSRFIDCNQATLDMLGMKSKDQLLATNAVNLSPERQPDGRLSSEKVKEMIDLTLQKGNFRFEWTHLRANGEAFPVEITMSVVKEQSKTILYSVWRDITKHKLVEEALKRSEEILGATQLLTNTSGWEWDVQKQAMFWTEETYHIYDLTPPDERGVRTSEENIARSIECYSAKDRLVIETAFRMCTEEGKSYDLECQLTTAKGRQLCIRTVGQAIMENGKVIRVVGTIMDVTAAASSTAKKGKTNE
ncbi:MAG: PAS domain-containing protein [Oligoflexia bacterium]|nr:PAS domain-containing protein [Oligoflexia bacterium]